MHAQCRQGSCKNTCSLFHVITCTLFLESREPLCSMQRGASGPHVPPSLHQGQSGHSTWRMGSRMRTQCRCQAAEGLPSLCLSPRKLKQKLARLTYLWLMGVAGELLKGQFVQREKQKLIFRLTDKTEKQERSTRGCLKWTWNSYWFGFGLFFTKLKVWRKNIWVEECILVSSWAFNVILKQFQ